MVSAEHKDALELTWKESKGEIESVRADEHLAEFGWSGRDICLDIRLPANLDDLKHAQTRCFWAFFA